MLKKLIIFSFITMNLALFGSQEQTKKEKEQGCYAANFSEIAKGNFKPYLLCFQKNRCAQYKKSRAGLSDIKGFKMCEPFIHKYKGNGKEEYYASLENDTHEKCIKYLGSNGVDCGGTVVTARKPYGDGTPEDGYCYSLPDSRFSTFQAIFKVQKKELGK